MNTGRTQPQAGWPPYWLETLLGLALLAVLAGGTWFYHIQSQAMRQEVEKNLTTIAQLKVEQIAAWRNDQVDDAALLVPIVNPSAARFMTEPGDSNEAELRHLVQSVAAQHDYDEVLLVDSNGEQRWSLTGNLEGYREYIPYLADALGTGEPVFIDLHQDTRHRSPHTSVVVPLWMGNQMSVDPPGALILINNASKFLYPLIQSWPVTSETAETLLVRREGDQVIFLNDLRHQAGAALTLRIPMSQTDVPAVMAVQGIQGFVMGEDYRGVPVAAVLLPVPGSPWFMVSKVDADEAFSEWHFRSVILLISILSFMVLAGAVGIALQQRGEKVHYRALYHSETALRLALERHGVTLRAIGDAVIATDAQGFVEMINPAAETLIGWKAEQVKGKPLGEVFRIVNALNGEPAPDPVQRVMETGKIVGLANHTLLITQDGRKIPIADSAAPIQDGSSITGVVLVFRDQSDAYLQQKIQDTRLRLFEYVPEHSLNEVLTQTLDEVEAITGSAIGFYHFLEPDQETLSLQAWSTRTKKEFCTASGEGLHYAVSQAGVWVDCIHARKGVTHNDYASLAHKKGLPEGHAEVIRELVVPVFRKGKIVAILGVGNKESNYTQTDVETVHYLADMGWEIAEKKRADEDRAQQQALLQAVFANAPLVMMVVDGERRVRQVNRFTTQFTSRSAQEMMGLRDGEALRCIHALDSLEGCGFGPHCQQCTVRNTILDTLENNVVHRQLETSLPLMVAGKEEQLVFLLSSNPLNLDGEHLALVTILDITERVRTQQELRHLKDELEDLIAERTNQLEEKVQRLAQSERAMLYMVEDLNQITADLKEERRRLELSNHELEAFAYSVSHDLRAPLRAINGYANFLTQDYAHQLDAEGKRFITIIQQSATKMDRLISDLLNLSRVSRVEMHRVVVNLGEVASSIYHEVASENEKADFEIDIQALPQVTCDLALIKQVWQNLLDNALKYSSESTTKKIEIGGQQAENEVILWIKDHGCGFDEQYKHKLFGVFQRLHKEKDYEGSGVGLAIVQRIIHRHGGRVWADGKIGEGAVFYFSLPRE